MQTIEEYKAYTKQLENEVGKWHHAYDALMFERNKLAKEIKAKDDKIMELRGIIVNLNKENRELNKEKI